jgi:transposase
MPVRPIATEGTTADCTQASALIGGISADYLLADKAYDTDAILDQAEAQGIRPCIPPKKNRKVQRPYDKDLYKLRHIVENTFLHLKQWRGIATRYAKTIKSYLAAVHCRCIMLWAQIS